MQCRLRPWQTMPDIMVAISWQLCNQATEAELWLHGSQTCPNWGRPPGLLSMAPKHARCEAAAEDPAKRFRADVGNLFLDNILSGHVAQQVAASASAAGARGVGEFARAGASGKHPGNCARDCLSRLTKGHKKLWAPLYYADIPVLNIRTSKEELKQIPFMLPHAVLKTWLQRDPGMLPWLGPAEPDMITHCRQMVTEWAADPRELIVPVGLHGDGVPFDARRSKSIEIFSWNLCGLPWPEGGLRVPLTAVPKHFVIKERTFEAILSVFCWSMRMLAIGSCPTARHDGRGWKPGDSLASFSGQPIGRRACLFEVRGDWSWFKSTLRLPGWKDGGGCCWLCRTTPATLRETSPASEWRTTRLSHSDFLKRMNDKGEVPSVLFFLPGVRNTSCRPDWLHCCDLGITPDALANIFLTVLRKFPGVLKKKCERLWQEMQAWYKRTGASSRLDMLTMGMLVQPKKPPKLRSKGAEARHLVPFALEVARTYLLEDNEHERSVLKVARELAKMYECLRLQDFDSGAMALAAGELAGTWVQLEAATPGRGWTVKPKLHLVLELCTVTALAHGSPTLYWCYKDEDAGGRGAKAARRRGGKQTAASAARSVLLRFMARNSLPSSSAMRSSRARA